MKYVHALLKAFNVVRNKTHEAIDSIFSSRPVKAITTLGDRFEEARERNKEALKKVDLKESKPWSLLFANLAFKIFTWRNTKWLLLFSLLVLACIITLTLYDGLWGLGLWEDSSDGVHFQEGPGQWRMKQMLITFIAGGALAFAGVLLQKITRNNLAEVSLLGIGSINIMFIFGYIMVFKDKVFDGSTVQKFLPVVTIFASLLGTLIVWALARSKRANRNTFAIIGIALQFLFEALSVIFINPTQLGGTPSGKKIWSEIKNYTMGNISQVTTPFWMIIVAGIVIAVCIMIALFMRKKIDIYESNPVLAKTLGVRVEGLRLGVFVIVALIAGVEASILGTVALLGLIAPSIARMLFKNKMMPLSIASIMIGGLLVMGASIVSINLGTELPIGILSTAIATPYFVFLIIRGK